MVICLGEHANSHTYDFIAVYNALCFYDVCVCVYHTAVSTGPLFEKYADLMFGRP